MFWVKQWHQLSMKPAALLFMQFYGLFECQVNDDPVMLSLHVQTPPPPPPQKNHMQSDYSAFLSELAGINYG